MKDKSKPGYVYKIIFDIPEPHVVYVGSTTQKPNERLGHHSTIQQKPTKLNKLIRANGRDHFHLEIIEYVPDYEKRFEREHYWTLQFKNVPDNCNECIGNEKSINMRESASLNSYRNRNVVCENDGKVYRSCTAAAQEYGLIVNDVSECCARHLRQSKGYYFRYEDEDKELYVAYWNTGIKRNRRIRCVETGVVYKNSVEAARAFGVHHTSIARCCKEKCLLHKANVHLVFED